MTDDTPLALTSATELTRLYAAGSLTPAEVLAAHRARIEELPVLNAWLSVWPADQAAPLAEGPLAGIGVGVKDNFDTTGRITTYASSVHRHHVPSRDATAVARLRGAGATIIGKTHLHEYALGVSTENEHYGDCLNPHDHGRIAGGSSGGSAVAVATGMCCVGLGSDTSGSIRIPAAACGVVGLKPTFGLIGKTGCYPEAPSLDTVGSLTRTVADAALMLDVLSGHDPTDPTSLNLAATGSPRTFDTDLSGVRIGIERDFFFHRIDERVAKVVDAAIERLEGLGAQLVEVELPRLADATWALTVIDTVETTDVHRRMYAEQRDAYGADVRELIERGELPSGIDHLRAERVRTEVRAEFTRTFTGDAGVDALVAPTLPIVTPRRGEQTVRLLGQDCVRDDELMRLVGPANLAGLPSMSVPCGDLDLDGAAMPVGLQLIGPALGEARLLRIAGALEAAG